MSLARLVPMQPVQRLAESVAFYEKLGFVVEARRARWAGDPGPRPNVPGDTTSCVR